MWVVSSMADRPCAAHPSRFESLIGILFKVAQGQPRHGVNIRIPMERGKIRSAPMLATPCAGP